jgi:hypothetical protein
MAIAEVLTLGFLVEDSESCSEQSQIVFALPGMLSAMVEVLAVAGAFLAIFFCDLLP